MPLCRCIRAFLFMRITINGKPEEIKTQSNLAQLILSRGLAIDNLVIEHNLRIVPKQQWQNITLEENDTIEIIGFVGGG